MNMISTDMNECKCWQFFFAFSKLLRHFSVQHFSLVLMRWHMRNIKQHSHNSWLVKLAKAQFLRVCDEMLFRYSLIFNLQSGEMETVTFEQTRTGSLMLTLHSVENISKEFSCLITCCHVSICWKTFRYSFFCRTGSNKFNVLIHSKNIVFCTFANFMCRLGRGAWVMSKID